MITNDFSAYLPPEITQTLSAHLITQTPADQARFLTRFHTDDPPKTSHSWLDASSWLNAFTLFITYFGGIFPLIPYIIVPRNQVLLALKWSIGIAAVVLFIFGWIKTVVNVGAPWKGRWACWLGLRGALEMCGVVAVAAGLSVVIIRGIDHSSGGGGSTGG